MQRIKLSQAAPGMVTARPIEASNGQVLCAKGTSLSEALISRLERLDISHITVEGHPVDDGTPRKTLEEKLADIDQRFSRVSDDKLMMALKVVVQKHVKEFHTRLEEQEAAEAARMGAGEGAEGGGEAAPSEAS